MGLLPPAGQAVGRVWGVRERTENLTPNVVTLVLDITRVDLLVVRLEDYMNSLSKRQGNKPGGSKREWLRGGGAMRAEKGWAWGQGNVGWTMMNPAVSEEGQTHHFSR